MTGRIALIGFGEAGSAIGAGLAEAGARMVAHDSADPQSAGGERARERASASGITLVPTVREAVTDARLVISVVVPSAAIPAAEKAVPWLDPDQLFLDLNSVGPATKRALAAIIEASGAAFVEGAILAAVPPRGHRVPIALAGEHAAAVIAILAPLGANLEALGTEIGAAAALKMQRSLLVKGLEALFLESIAGSERYGITERVLDSMEDSFPGAGWKEIARYLTGRTALHAARRAGELREVATSLEEVGVEPIMASAIVRRLAWAAGIDVSDLIDGESVDTDRVWRRYAGLPDRS